MRISTFVIILFAMLSSCNRPSGQVTSDANKHRYTNKLVNESSPYLLQHAHNPVDWYPWGDAALAKAKKEDKLIIISVGYAACHWCHVMEHESFEDTTVSNIMNEHFVSIKVDREERPDVDDVYMTACQLASKGGCGWPLNAFALPDGRPVWAGTYFPKENWMEILEYFQNLYDTDREKLEEYAKQITEGIRTAEEINLRTGDFDFSKETLSGIADQFMRNIDYEWGGRNGAPKFPMPNNWDFLLSYHYRTGDEKALEAVTTTLDKMAIGGIYDQLGGGFARYSTDSEWIVPHFEKMLYDNGQLVSLYANAFKLTQNPMYKKVVDETLTFIDRELSDENGGFYSSLDADSEGEEGKFYVWQKSEIDSLLVDENTIKVYSDYFNIKAKGNWEHSNILYRTKVKEDIAKKHDLSIEDLDQLIAQANKKLFDARASRIRPGLDDKVLTSWNALMLKGYVDAYKAFGTAAYKERALKNADFLLQNMLQDRGRLNRNYKDGQSVINAFLDDYALSIQAFIALYEITFDEKWLNTANQLSEYVLAHFSDEETGMFNYTSDLDPPLVARKMELSDNVIPGSNSSMARSLFYLGTYLYKSDYIERAQQMMYNMITRIEATEMPNFYSNWCLLYADLTESPYEVAILGEDFEAIREQLMANYLPTALFLGGKSEGDLELLKDKLVEGETMIYVCQNKVCKLPVNEADEALKLIR